MTEREKKVPSSPRQGQWLSFIDPDKPQGQRFLGVVSDVAGNIQDACAKAHELGINPGGEARSVPVELDKYRPEDINRLLNKEEATKLAKKA